MKRTLIAVLAASLALPAFAEDLTLSKVKDLPFSKALAYAHAAKAYCFIDPEISSALYAAAAKQKEITGDEHPLADAFSHLKGDYAACAPALAFVSKTEAEAPEAIVQMQALGDAMAAAKQNAQSRAAVGTCAETLQRAKKAEYENLSDRAVLQDCIKNLMPMPETQSTIDGITVLLNRE